METHLRQTNYLGTHYYLVKCSDHTVCVDVAQSMSEIKAASNSTSVIVRRDVWGQFEVMQALDVYYRERGGG